IRQVRSYSAIDSREVPTESYGFMAATRRKLLSAATRPSRGTLISPSDMTVSRTLIVSSGTRLSSSTYRSPPSRMARTSGPSEKFSGRYPCASTSAGSKDPMRRAGVSSALPSTSTNSACRAAATCRSKVDLPVPGGPSSRMWAPDASAARTSSSSRWRPTTCLATRSVLVDDHAAHVLAGQQVVVALVDLVQGVRPGDDLVELEVAGLVQPEDLGDGGGRVAVAEQAALDRVAEQGQDRPRHGNGRYLQLVQPGHHDGAALADRVEPGLHDFGRHQIDGEDGRVSSLPPGHLGDGPLRLFGGGERVGRAEFHRLLTLVLQRVDGDDVLRAGVAGALDRVDADAADAVDRDRVAGGDVRGVHGGAPPGRHAAPDQHGLLQRQVVVDLDGRGLADHAVLAEGADHAHGAVLPAGPGDREPRAGQVALEDRRAHVADRLAAGGAVAADTAVRDERADDVVTGCHTRHAHADLLDDPRAFVAQHHRQPRREIAVRDVDVGVAQAGVGVADEDLAFPRPIQVELFDLDALAGLVDDSGLGLHRHSSRLGDGPNSSPASGR